MKSSLLLSILFLQLPQLLLVGGKRSGGGGVGGGGPPPNPPAPTSKPTSKPTSEPTAKPTRLPTLRPTTTDNLPTAVNDKFLANCATPETLLETHLSVDVLGHPSQLIQTHLDQLKLAFEETYNSLAQFNCDNNFRRIENVDIQVYDYSSESTLTMPVNINLIFRVTFSCRGPRCTESPDIPLFSLDNGVLGRGDGNSSRKHSGGGIGSNDGQKGDDDDDDNGRSRVRNLFEWQHRRQLADAPQEDDDICGVCDTNRPSERSPSPRQFVDTFRDAVFELNQSAIDSVTNILEILPQYCQGDDEEGEFFNETIYFELNAHPKNVTAEDLEILGETFVSSYNLYAEVQCDERFLRVDSVEISSEAYVLNNRRRSLQNVYTTYTKDTYYNFTSILSFYYFGNIFGYCRFCRGDFLMVNDAIDRKLFSSNLEKRGMRGSVHSYHDETKLQRRNAGPATAVVQSRMLHLGDTILGPGACFCAKEAVDTPVEAVSLNDCLNTTFEEERKDTRYRGLDRYRGVQFGRGGGRGGSNRRLKSS